MEEKKVKKITKAKQQELENLVSQYGVDKKHADNYKKLAGVENESIKTIMLEYSLTEAVGGDFKVSMHISHSESMDEAKVLEMLIADNEEQYKKLGIIKYKPFIDEECLESAIYKGELTPVILQKLAECKIVKDTPTLRVKPAKEEK